jgi:hexokinase
LLNSLFSASRDAISGSSNTSTIKVLEKFNYRFNIDYDEDDVKVIQYTTALVSYRAALLVSICTSVLLNRMSEKEITIAVDGSVYKHHPRIKTWMEQLITKMSPGKDVSCKINKLTSFHSDSLKSMTFIDCLLSILSSSALCHSPHFIMSLTPADSFD